MMSAGFVNATEMALPKPADANVAARMYEGERVGGACGTEGLCWGCSATAIAWSRASADAGFSAEDDDEDMLPANPEAVLEDRKSVV